MLSRRAAVFAGLASPLSAPSFRVSPQKVRVGVLHFGSVAWELDVIRRHGLDVEHGFEIHPIPFADAAGCEAALRAGTVEIAAQDWLFVARARLAGTDWRYSAFSTGIGALLAPADGSVRALPDVAGARLGVASGALDINWLVLRACARQRGLDLTAATVRFGPPPALAEEMVAGRLDAMLTHWPAAARAEADGAIRVLDMGDAVRGLGVTAELPVAGYVFSDGWARANRTAIDGFLAASAAARVLLRVSDGEWTRLWPKMGTNDSSTFEILRDRFRGFIPRADPATHLRSSAQLSAALGTGALPDGVFWQP